MLPSDRIYYFWLTDPTMKKIYFICLCFCLLGNGLFAQYRPATKSYFGVYTGINLSGFSGNFHSNVPGESGKVRLRTQFGLYGNIYIQTEFSIYTALELVLKGAKTKGENVTAGETVAYQAKTNLTTFSLPVLFNYTPKPEWGLMIGPQLTYISSAKEPWYASDFYKPDGYQENVLYKFNPYSVEVVLAFNYLLYNGVTFQLRYTRGVMPIVKKEYGDSYSSSIMFFVGINFPKGTGSKYK